MPQRVSTKRLVGDHTVEDAPSFAPGSHVAGFAQVTEDQRDAALRELQPLGHVAHAQARARSRSPAEADRGSLSSDQSAKVSQSLRLVDPRRRLKDDKGSPLHLSQVGILWRGLKGFFCG